MAKLQEKSIKNFLKMFYILLLLIFSIDEDVLSESIQNNFKESWFDYVWKYKYITKKDIKPPKLDKIFDDSGKWIDTKPIQNTNIDLDQLTDIPPKHHQLIIYST